MKSSPDPQPWSVGDLAGRFAVGRHQVLEAYVAELDRRMTEMARSREMTLHALGCRSHDIATCPRFQAGVDDLVARAGRS